jgi:hypothetical protein
MDENNVEVTSVTENTPTPAEAFASETPVSSGFTAEDIAKARAQEKAKLYPQLSKLEEELTTLKNKEAEREAKETERKAQRAARDAELAKQKKAEEEQSLELRELLSKKEQEFQAQLDIERQEREKAFALLDQERTYQELQTYRQQRLEQERDNIIPQLIDLVSGNSQDEIEQSILGLKERSAKIFEDVALAGQQNRKEMVGTRITSPASGPLDNDSAQLSLTPEAIANMSQAEYAKNRAKLLGTAGNNRGQGLFG